MVIRNSKLDLGLSLSTALFNAVLSLLVLALLTQWSLLPFAIILGLVFLLYSGFAFVTWKAESLEVTPQKLTVNFGIKTKQSKIFTHQEVTFKRLRTKKLHQLLGLVRCELQLPNEQKITLTLRSDRALELEHYFYPLPLVIPQVTANRLVFRDVFRFIIADTHWLRRSLNLSALPMIVGILFFPDMLIQIPLWVYLSGFIVICFGMKIIDGIHAWLQTRYFRFERHDQYCVVRTGFFVPKTQIFQTTDIVLLEIKQALGYQLHHLASIHLTIDIAKKVGSTQIILAPLLEETALFTWLQTNFPEIDLQSSQYRPVKHALVTYLFSGPILMAGLISIVLIFSTQVRNLPLLLITISGVLIIILSNQFLLWRSSYLCQLDDAFIIDTLGLTRRLAYCRKQYSQAFIHQSRFQKKKGIGTFRLSFPQQSIPTIFFKGIAQER